MQDLSNLPKDAFSKNNNRLLVIITEFIELMVTYICMFRVKVYFEHYYTYNIFFLF